MLIGKPRYFHEQIIEKSRDLLHFDIIVGLSNIADSYFSRNDMYLLFENKSFIYIALDLI